ncbi:MAG: SRPBCC family protein [Phenylobacterium sp.]
MSNPTTAERKSDREIVVTRIFDAPARIVFEAWTKAELFRLWWPPKSLGMPLLSCEMDVRVGGGYRLEFGQDASQSFAFFGKYLEVIPPSRLVWSNDESPDGPVTTVTFEERDGATFVVLSELYPSKEAFEASGGAADGLPEQFEQLDDLLATLGASV